MWRNRKLQLNSSTKWEKSCRLFSLANINKLIWYRFIEKFILVDFHLFPQLHRIKIGLDSTLSYAISSIATYKERANISIFSCVILHFVRFSSMNWTLNRDCLGFSPDDISIYAFVRFCEKNFFFGFRVRYSRIDWNVDV